jgi:hypothetical protein
MRRPAATSSRRRGSGIRVLFSGGLSPPADRSNHMPQRFTATENAFEKGIENTSAKQGAKLVGEWVEEVRKADFTGSKGLASELERLEKLLQADEPDVAKLQPLLEKIGQDTAKAADRADDPKIADKVRKLAEAMGAKQTA